MTKKRNGNNGNTEGLKRLLVKFVGGEKEPQEVLIGPGTTTADLLRELDLNTNNFSLGRGQADDVFGADEALYPQLDDGGLVYASSQVIAGQ
jgi:hypothetical protein